MFFALVQTAHAARFAGQYLHPYAATTSATIVERARQMLIDALLGPK
jgi:hypothetical protein